MKIPVVAMYGRNLFRLCMEILEHLNLICSSTVKQMKVSGRSVM